ncbi:MAG: hypothetical protein FWG32_00185 [Oscillospiraceae bacterium]|nr:hypothetical protein [Oscillospiraceae bacterium]
MQENAKWQAIFGVVLLVAVIAAVIALITIGLSGEEEPAPTPTVEITPPPPPTPTPTPPTPTPPEVSAIQINYGNEQRTEFAMSIGNKIPLNATIYPLDLEATANWSSTDEDICTIDKDGVVTAVGSGWGMVIAECGGVEAKCHVLVW